MKILSFDRKPGSDVDTPIGVEMLPDSSIIKDGKPFFVPSFSNEWSYRLGLALRNGRLGKNVGERFASRYIDAMALCVITRPDDAVAAHEGLQHALLNCHEGAIILGDWMPLTDSAAPLTATIGDFTADLSGEIEKGMALFSMASRAGVMKIGDIIVACNECFAMNLPVDTLVEGTLNQSPALHFRIK